jgi:curved DNA-binding protein CbpA
MVVVNMSVSEAYQTLELKNGASTSDVTKAWKRLQKHWHPDKNNNSFESTEHTKRLNSAKDLLMKRAETHDPFDAAWWAQDWIHKAQEELKQREESLRQQQEQQERFRKAQEEHKQQEERMRQQREKQLALLRKQKEEWKREQRKRQEEHKQQLVEEKALFLQQVEEIKREERRKDEELKQLEERLRQQWEEQELFRKQKEEMEREQRKQQEEKERERLVQAEKAKERGEQVKAQMAKKKAKQTEDRRAKARTTKRETNRKEVIFVYNGPDLDQTFVQQHLVALKIVHFKGRIIDTEKGTKAVWVMFAREVRRTAIQKAITKHNLSAEGSMKIRLGLEGQSHHIDEVIICSNDRKRLQNHKMFLFIMSGKGQDAGYWEL